MSLIAADFPADPLAQLAQDPTDHESDIIDLHIEGADLQLSESNHQSQNGGEPKPSDQVIDGVDENERLDAIQQTEFYFSDANLPYDKFMFLQTSPHLDPVKAPNMSAEAKKKAEDYGPGCSPILFQTVASFKRMREFTSKYPTSKLVEIIQSSTREPKLVEITSEELNGNPTFYIRRVLKLKETNRIGASDRCVYVKGFLSEEDLAKNEPAGMQATLEKWAKKWGALAVLRMRREDGPKDKKDHGNRDKKWKNSVFIEYQEPGSAEKLVHQFKQENEKPQFEGRELSSIMFKIDYITTKAQEKGFAVPQMSGRRKAGESTSKSHASFGGNSSHFNAFKELREIEDGTKQYAGVPASKKTNDEEKFIEYEGNKLSVNKDGLLKNTEELKSYQSNIALGFELHGEAPTDFKEARVNFLDLKKDLTMQDLVCQVVHLARDNDSKGTVTFNQPINDEQMAMIQAKGIRSGGRSVTFMRLSEEENKQYHLECAMRLAKSTYGPKDTNNNRHQRGNKRDRGGKRGRGGRDGGRGHHGGSRGNGRNGEKEIHENPTGDASKNNHTPNVAGNKRDAEGNVISTGEATNLNTSVPEVGRASKKSKI